MNKQYSYRANPNHSVTRRRFVGRAHIKKIFQCIVFAAVGLSISLRAQNNAPTKYNEMTIAELQAQMAAGTLTSVELTNFYLARIAALDQSGTDNGVNSVIELNPDALNMAEFADRLRAQGRVHGPLHGIPVLIKDNIDTGDKMQTTAGSFALFGQPALQDSTVAAKLRAGGTVILGKTNLSEWANFRSFESITKRSVSRVSEKQLDTNGRPGSEGGNHSTLHEPQSRSLQEYDAAPYRAAYADVLRGPGKLVPQIATPAPATPSRSQFQCPRKMIRRTSRCDPALRSIPRTPERRRLNSHD